MGLFDMFKKKTQQSQRNGPVDFNPLDISSVIGYIKEEKPDATVQDVANIISRLAEPDEDQEHLTPEGTLPLGWRSVHEKEIMRYTAQYKKYWSEWFDSRSAPPREHMDALDAFVNYMRRAKKSLAEKGECFNYWRDELFTDDYLERWSKELYGIKSNIDSLELEYKARKAFESNVLPTLEEQLLTIVHEKPGILQKEIYKMYAPEAKKYIQEKLYYAEKTQKITREKHGSTYKLFIKQA